MIFKYFLKEKKKKKKKYQEIKSKKISSTPWKYYIIDTNPTPNGNFFSNLRKISQKNKKMYQAQEKKPSFSFQITIYSSARTTRF